jgi:hypothetical protein
MAMQRIVNGDFISSKISTATLALQEIHVQKSCNATFLILSIAALVTSPAYAVDPFGGKHVLLISIDGMHALDYENCVNSSPSTCPNLKALGMHGVNYPRTSTSKPSDSFPGLMAIVTGGSPKSVGAWYDVAYDRALAPPAIETGNGNPPGDCMPSKPGATTEYEEGNEIDQSKLNGGSPNYTTLDGGIQSIDPRKLNRDPFNSCNPVYSWNFIRTNSIYGVIHGAGGYTAWADKHAAYAAVNGHQAGASPTNVDDYYSPEVNSNVISLPTITTALGESCTAIPADVLSDWTTSFKAIRCYDQLKVNAVVNQINGNNHLHTNTTPLPVPVIFGMNFQAVSVGQKLVNPTSGVGGYTDAAGTPTMNMSTQIEFVDAAIGQMINAMSPTLLANTTIIITAKHGQSPVDPHRFFPIPGHSPLNNGTSPTTILWNNGSNSLIAQTDCEFASVHCAKGVGGGLGPTEDDVSLIWLANSNKTAEAVEILENNATTAGIGQIFFGASITTAYDSPAMDSRTPDIIVAPNVGVVYTGSNKKQAEHGGFANDDTNVMLLVSNPSMGQSTVFQFVETKQVAPTILKFLGLDPNTLDAVKMEGTVVLPGLLF